MSNTRGGGSFILIFVCIYHVHGHVIFLYVRLRASASASVRERLHPCVRLCERACVVIVTPDFLIVFSRVHWHPSVAEIETVINNEIADY